MEIIRNNRWTFACGIVVALVAYLAAREGFVEVLLDGQRLTDIGTLLATAIFAALVIERAVEVIISNRYAEDEEAANGELLAARAERDVHKAAVKTAQQLSVATTQAEAALTKAEADLATAQKAAVGKISAVKQAKAHSAALLTISFGLAAAVVGMRIFGTFIYNGDGDLLPVFTTDERALQLALFRFVDIVLSAVVLAGGADGIHKIISAFKAPSSES